MDHPWTREKFETDAPEIVTFVLALLALYNQGKRHILIKAPVKSGKRIMVEAIRLFFDRSTKYVTALNRKDVKDQQAELQRYGIKTHLLKDAAAAEAAKRDINYDLHAGTTVICCYDECDYGSGANQVSNALFEEFRNDTRVLNLYFSATAHETALSNLAMRADYESLEYVPPPTYRGAGFFLANNLVSAPLPFFDYEDNTLSLTQHAFQVLRDSIKPDRHIGVVRVAGKGIKMELFKDKEKAAALEQRLNRECPGKPWKIVPIDEKTAHRWEHEETRDGYVTQTNKNYLFVIKQTCGRGTDLKGWHPKLAFWHDARAAEKTNLNTSIQAALRPSHYSPRPGEEHKMPGYRLDGERIHLYVDRRIVQVAMDDDMDTYLKAGGKAPARTRVRKMAPYALSKETFRSVEEAQEWGYARGIEKVYPRRLDETGHYPYRGPGGKAGRRKITTEEETRAMELGDGVKDAARIIPFRRNGAGELGYLVAYSLADDDDASSVSSTMSLETTKKSMYEKK